MHVSTWKEIWGANRIQARVVICGHFGGDYEKPCTCSEGISASLLLRRPTREGSDELGYRK